MTEQTPKLDAQTLKYVHSLMFEEFERLTCMYHQMMERGAKNDAKMYIIKRREVHFLSSEIFRSIEQAKGSGMNDSKLPLIIANNAIKEIREIRRNFVRGNMSFEQAHEASLSIRNMLYGISDDLYNNNIADGTEAIRSALHEIEAVRDMIYDHKGKLEVYESKLRKELKLQIDAEQQEA